MKVFSTPLEGLTIIEPDVYTDPRGYFFETYSHDKLMSLGIEGDFVQDNESFSKRGVVRGIHYQLIPFAQAKLVRVVIGRIYDVAVDLRKGSPTFGKWYGIELSGDDKRQLFIPRGFAHGFSVLSETAVFVYKCDGVYNREAERSIRFNDPVLDIDWKIPENELIVSDKDRQAPELSEADINFAYVL
jgi:dTDP-4-dehydrorhamnose 3,5-epimerase